MSGGRQQEHEQHLEAGLHHHLCGHGQVAGQVVPPRGLSTDVPATFALRIVFRVRLQSMMKWWGGLLPAALYLQLTYWHSKTVMTPRSPAVAAVAAAAAAVGGD